jgi:hypothetical protein
MKKIIFLLSIAFTTVLNVSCSKDNEDPLQKGEIEGSWKVTSSNGTINSHTIKDGRWSVTVSTGIYGFFLYEEEGSTGASITVMVQDNDGIGTFVNDEDVMIIYDPGTSADTWSSTNNQSINLKVVSSKSGDYFDLSFTYDDGDTKIEGSAKNIWMI